MKSVFLWLETPCEWLLMYGVLRWTPLKSPYFPGVLGDEGALRPVQSGTSKGSNGFCEGFDGKLGNMHSDHQKAPETLRPACLSVATWLGNKCFKQQATAWETAWSNKIKEWGNPRVIISINITNITMENHHFLMGTPPFFMGKPPF